MEIKINLDRDSDNTEMPFAATITVNHRSKPTVQIDLINPDRTIEIDAEELLKILNILF